MIRTSSVSQGPTTGFYQPGERPAQTSRPQAQTRPLGEPPANAGEDRSSLSSLRNKRPDLSGRPPWKGVAIGVARRGGRLNGERTLRAPPCWSLPVSHAGGPHVASFVVGRPCKRGTCVRAGVARRALPKRIPVARGDSAKKLVTRPLGRSGPQFLCRGVGDDLLRTLPLSRRCPLHWADGPAFTGG